MTLLTSETASLLMILIQGMRYMYFTSLAPRNRESVKSYKCWILASFIFLTLLTACSAKYENQEGITFIAPLGDPPIDRIIWSPFDRDKILVTANELGRGRAEVYILNISSNEKNVLAIEEYGGIWAETWLPDAEHIVLEANADTAEFGMAGYWIISINGDKTEFFSQSSSPHWSPDGKTIMLYTVDREQFVDRKEIKLHLTDVKTNQDKIIYSNVGTQGLFGLSWSSDSKRLVYSLGDFNSRNLYVVDLRTQTTNQLTHGGRNETPVWSPKEDIIAYIKVTDDGLFYSLHLIRPDGSCDIEIPNIDDIRSPTWSPDGKAIAFIGSDGVYTLEIEEYTRSTLCS